MSQSLANSRRLHLTEITTESPEAQTTVGGLLRAARIRAGEDLKTVSRDLRIKAEFLEALEEGRPESLPGRAYAIGFLRSYADYLHLDSGECLGRYKAEFPSDAALASAEPMVSTQKVEEEVRLPKGTAFIFLIFIVMTVYGGWYLFRSANEALESRVKPVPDALVQTEAPVPAPAPAETLQPLPGDVSQSVDPTITAPAPVFEVPPEEAAAAAQAAAAAEAAVTEAGVDPALVVDPAAPSADAVAEEAETVPPPPEDPADAVAEPPTAGTPPPSGRVPLELAKPAETPVAAPAGPQAANVPPVSETVAPPAGVVSEPLELAKPEAPPVDFGTVVAGARRTFGAPTRDNRVVLRAEREVFVRVETEGDRPQVLFEGMLQPGELYFLPVTNDAVLVTRDGGSVELFLDRRSVGNAGPEGVALKGLSLNPEKIGR